MAVGDIARQQERKVNKKEVRIVTDGGREGQQEKKGNKLKINEGAVTITT